MPGRGGGRWWFFSNRMWVVLSLAERSSHLMAAWHLALPIAALHGCSLDSACVICRCTYAAKVEEPPLCRGHEGEEGVGENCRCSSTLPPRLLGSRTVGGEDGDLCPSLCSSLGELPASVARLRTERGRGLDGGGDDVTDWMRPCRIKVIDIGYVQSVPAGGLDGWTGNRVHCAVGYGAESLSSSRRGMPLRPLEIHPFGVRVPRHRHPICR